MKKCPQCQVDLTVADLTQGKCSECGASLADVATRIAEGEAGDVAAPGDGSTSDPEDRRTIATSDTRREHEDSRRTIAEGEGQGTEDRGQRTEGRDQSKEASDASKTLADVSKTVEVPVDIQQDDQGAEDRE